MEEFFKELFKGINEEEIEEIKSLFKQVSFSKGSTILKEGEWGEEVYILKEGTVEVTKKTKLLAELKSGDIIGEMSLLEKKPRSATVIASKDAILLEISQDGFLNLLKTKPILAITLLKTFSTRLRALDEKIVDRELQEERLSILGKLSSTIIHDLKSPLSAIKGYTLMLKDELEDQTLKSYIKTMESSVNFVFDLIEDVLEFGRDVSTINIQKVKVSRFFEDITELFKGSIDKKRIKLLVNVPPDLYVDLDPFKMKRVFLNLLKNSGEAIKDEGEIELGIVEVEGGIKFYVRDNGKGMPENVIGRIFDPFFTFGKSGSGLGMTVVKKVVEDHKGKIEVKSKVGKGTTFSIFISNSGG